MQSLEGARGESGEGGIGEDEVDKLNQELKDMRDSLAEKSKKLTERTEGAAKYDGFSFWVKIICRTHKCKLFRNMKTDVICHCKNCTFILTKDETEHCIPANPRSTKIWGRLEIFAL